MFKVYDKLPQKSIKAIDNDSIRREVIDYLENNHVAEEHLKNLGFFITQDFTEDGVGYTKYWCNSCKKSFTVKQTGGRIFRYNKPNVTCEHCGSFNYVESGHRMLHPFQGYVVKYLEKENFLIIIPWNIHSTRNNLSITIDDIEHMTDYEEFYNNYLPTYEVSEFYVFVPGKGSHRVKLGTISRDIATTLVCNGRVVFELNDCSNFKLQLADAYSVDVKDNLIDAINSASIIDFRKVDTESKNKEVIKRQKNNEVMENLLKIPVANKETLHVAPESAMGLVVSRYGTHNKGYFYCPSEDRIINFEFDDDSLETTYYEKYIKCPICGKKHNFHYSVISGGKDYVSKGNNVCWMDYNEDYLILRSIYTNISMSYEKGKCSIEKDIKEVERTFIGNKKVYTIRDVDIHPVMVSSRFLSSASRKLRNTESDVQDILNNSIFKNSGLLEAWGLNPTMNTKCYEIGDFRYLNGYFERPQLEMLIKSGLKNIVKDIVNGNTPANKVLTFNNAATNPKEFLKVSNYDWKVIREHDFSLREFAEYMELRGVDKNTTYEEFVYYSDIDRFGYQNDNFLWILKDMNISISKQVEYLQKCYDHQCIHFKEALSLWADYLKMGLKLKYNFKDKNILYPTSLKKEHDIAMFAMDAIKEKIKAEEFNDAVEQGKWLMYKNKSYQIILPTCAEDVVNEGKNLKHCVRTYVNKIIDKGCMIVFVRKTEDPDVSFYTIEVSPRNEIVQIRGFCNCAPTEEVKKFVKEWATKKSLKY